MKKIILTTSCLGFIIKSFACADFSMDYAFYNLFDQTLVKDKNLHHFLLTYDNTYYERSTWNPAEKSLDSVDYNILEWQKFFENQISTQDLKYLVYKSSLDELNNIINTKKLNTKINYKIILTEHGIEALKYLVFAKKCEPFAVQVETYDNWTYMSGRGKQTKSQFMQTAKEGNILYTATKNTDLKLRIAYQLVRLSHYAGFNDDALRYFNTYVVPLNKKNLIYYYALEQKAGALYNQKKYAMAAQNYIEVFNQTPDRQLAVYTSFLMNKNLFINAENTLKTPEEKTTLYMLRAYNTFANGLAEMKKIYNLTPNASKLEVLAVRELNSIERKILELPNQYSKNNKFLKIDTKTKAYTDKIILFTETLLNNKNIVRTDFWKSYLAHVYFITGNYIKAENIAQSLIHTEDKKIANQATITAFAAYIAHVKSIDASAEQKIYDYLKNNKNEQVRQYIFEILGNKYLQQKNYAKAFLCHNDFSGLYKSLDLNIINDLIAFYNQNSRNNLEQELYNKNNKNALAYLYELKGTHYLKNDDLNNALIWFKKVPNNLAFLKDYEYTFENNIYNEKIIETKGFNGYSNLSAKMFSNGIRPYFEDAENIAMTDEVYKMQEFAFIPNYFNKQQLVEILIKLKSMAVENNELAARANYLLGNYYYNISAFGYYRNVLYYETGNYYLSYIYEYTENKPNNLINPYNYNGGTGLVYTNQLQKAYAYFLKAENVSKFNELKAKAVFQASKIELEQYFIKDNNDASYFSHDSYWDKPQQLYNNTNRPLFNVLKTKYSDTKYYKQIVSNCLYFKYYLSN
jgi:hypothetical protein